MKQVPASRSSSLEISDSLSCDYLIIGGGVAGLSAAIELADKGKVLILTKDSADESNTGYAQGGIAAALGREDSTYLHTKDTMAAGAGMCRHEVVLLTVEEGIPLVRRLIKWGFKFDRIGRRLDFTREAAHSARRILHAYGDATGSEMVRTLSDRVQKLNIPVKSFSMALDLLVKDGRCLGAVVLDAASGQAKAVLAKAVVLASGGLGMVYAETSNPTVATGDGFAMAYRAGAEMADMEFIQFHPTTSCLPGAPRFLISEAVRGEGGKLVNARGARFMSGYHPQAELAPRDVVSRAIVEEMRRTGEDQVYLDMRPLGRERIKQRFPSIYRFCQQYGVDPREQPVPVRPSAHFSMGGVRTDIYGRTNIPGLFACGEVACTFLHGANRLASNSLLEGLVFGSRAARGAMAYLEEEEVSFPDKIFYRGFKPSGGIEDCDARLDKWRQRMWEGAAVVKEPRELRKLVRLLGKELEMLISSGLSKKEEFELLNIYQVSSLIVQSALKRMESRGSHFRKDLPRPDPALAGWHQLARYARKRGKEAVVIERINIT